MKKRVPDKFWFPWWPDKWIFGSVRIECTPAERGIWVDLLSLASKDDGHIRANEETPYPLQQLAGMLIIPEDELEAAINKFIETEKLTKAKTGTLYITKWDKYQFSDRHKRRLEGEMSDETDIVSDDEDAILNKSTLEDNKLNNNEREILNLLKAVKNYNFNFEKDIEHIRKLFVEFPKVNILEEVKNKCTWWLDHPILKKSNPRSQLRNWMKKAVEFQKERKQSDRIGEKKEGDWQPPSKEEEEYSVALNLKVDEIKKKYALNIEIAQGKLETEKVYDKMKEEIEVWSKEYWEKQNK